MNINTIRPKNEAEDFLRSVTKNCKTIIEQTHTKLEETLEFKKIKPRKKVHFNPQLEVKEDWMIGLTDLEVCNPVFKITEKENKF